MKKNFVNKLTNAIDPAAPASVWGYRGCAGKGGKTKNANIVTTKPNTKESN